MLKLQLVHRDERGEVYSLTGLKDHSEVAILITKRGYSRGGCIHQSDEYCCVIEGEVEYHIRSAIFKMKKGDIEEVPKSAPHYYIAKEDNIMLEWGVDKSKEPDLKDPEMRKIVEYINTNQAKY